MNQFKNSRTLMGVTTKNRNLYDTISGLEDLNYIEGITSYVPESNFVLFKEFMLPVNIKSKTYPKRVLFVINTDTDTFRIFTEPNAEQTENLMLFLPKLKNS